MGVGVNANPVSYIKQRFPIVIFKQFRSYSQHTPHMGQGESDVPVLHFNPPFRRSCYRWIPEVTEFAVGCDFAYHRLAHAPIPSPFSTC